MFSEAVAGATSRRGFLARTGRLLLGVAGGGFVLGAIKAQKAEAFHFCGHIYTTGSCPHPTGLPRIDAHGFPLRAVDGAARWTTSAGRWTSSAGRSTPTASCCATRTATRCRRRRARASASGPAASTASAAQIDGAWYRCCDGHIRKLVDCCGYTTYRINGDYALTGYCYSGRHVFCVMYYDTKIAC